VKEHFCKAERSVIAYKGECNWCGQREWVGLTEDEIVLISADCAATHQHTDIHFARAIEAKLKEKNT
jgi:hypothetical protein